jgi:hypothetical protein
LRRPERSFFFLLQTGFKKPGLTILFKSNGFNFEKVLGRVAELLDFKPEQVLAVGKYKKTVEAPSLLCF